MHTPSWTALAQRFARAIVRSGGPSKLSSGYIKVVFWPPFETGTVRVRVEIGAYDIANWPRHMEIGMYATEDEALRATETKVLEAEVLAEREETDDDQPRL